ncbi:MAG TPA: flagellar protein FlgN [Candidatus Limnocylindria bacterium]|nr:flagellar protein FlgN [Candidatus Limnocylindria bacterium]
MKEYIEQLVEALRQELQQYGEMLARLDLQQELVVRRASDQLLDSVSQIEFQGVAIQDARRNREYCRRALAQAVGLAGEATFAEIIPRLPVDYRPLVGALVEENNALIHRVQQRSRQNHMLLTRTMELMQRLLGSLFPSTGTTTYSGSGTMLGATLAPRALYEAVG